MLYKINLIRSNNFKFFAICIMIISCICMIISIDEIFHYLDFDTLSGAIVTMGIFTFNFILAFLSLVIQPKISVNTHEIFICFLPKHLKHININEIDAIYQIDSKYVSIKNKILNCTFNRDNLFCIQTKKRCILINCTQKSLNDMYRLINQIESSS